MNTVAISPLMTGDTEDVKFHCIMGGGLPARDTARVKVIKKNNITPIFSLLKMNKIAIILILKAYLFLISFLLFSTRMVVI